MGRQSTRIHRNTYGATKAPHSSNKNQVATLSQERLIHADKGDFNQKGRMISGGHGQNNLEELKRRGEKLKIRHVFKNGVRLGSIPNHRNKYDRKKHAWFPKWWTDGTIQAAANYVASLKKATKAKNGETIYGTYKDVIVGIKINNGIIVSVFPSFTQSSKNLLKKGKEL